MRGSIEQVMIKGKSFERQGNLIEARKLYCSILEAFPSNIRVKKALSKLDENCSSQEGSNYLDRDPSPKIFKTLSNQFGTQKVAAIRSCENLLRDFNKSPKLWNMFGIFLSQNGELERGESAFRKGIDLNSESAAIYNNLGNNLKD